jgi:CRISPR-associated protein Cmr3
MRLFLEANDTFFFRDGRPFTKGEQSEGYSIFPPFPSTVMGALRTAWIAENGGLAKFLAGDMKSVIGVKDSLDGASIRIRGVFLGNRNDNLYFPTPRDLVSQKKSEDAELRPLYIERNPDFRSNSKLPALLMWNDSSKQVEHSGGWISCDTLRKYLLGNNQHLFAEKSNFVIDEPKVGITRSLSTLTSEEGMLYRINMKRFSDSKFGFVVDVEGIDSLPKNGLIKLGGEGKTFFYSRSALNPNPISDADQEQIEARIQETQMFKLYFATPAIFNQGWLPPGALHRDNPTWRVSATTQIELVTAAVGNYVTVGGWDVAAKAPKSAYRAVPAGSVYYFKLNDGASAADVFDFFHYKNHSDHRSQEGFGLAYVGAVSSETNQEGA